MCSGAPCCGGPPSFLPRPRGCQGDSQTTLHCHGDASACCLGDPTCSEHTHGCPGPHTRSCVLCFSCSESQRPLVRKHTHTHRAHYCCNTSWLLVLSYCCYARLTSAAGNNNRRVNIETSTGDWQLTCSSSSGAVLSHTDHRRGSVCVCLCVFWMRWCFTGKIHSAGTKEATDEVKLCRNVRNEESSSLELGPPLRSLSLSLSLPLPVSLSPFSVMTWKAEGACAHGQRYVDRLSSMFLLPVQPMKHL